MFVEQLLKKLREHKQDIEHILLQDSVDDFHSYRYLTGKLRGLDDAIEMIIEMCRKADANEL